MRVALAVAVLVALALTLGCSTRRRAEVLEGEWEGVSCGATREPGAQDAECQKLKMTFGKDGTLKMSATCTCSWPRSGGPQYKCDDSAPVETTYTVRQVKKEEVGFNVGGSGDVVRFDFSNPNEIQYHAFAQMGWIVMKRP